MPDSHTSRSVDPRLMRPLPRAVTVVTLTLCAAVLLGLLRGWHGSWMATGTALIAPGIVGVAALALAVVERTRGRPLPRWIVVPGFLLSGGAAGGLAAVLAPSLGSVGPAVLGGIFWGGIIGLGWARPRAAVR